MTMHIGFEKGTRNLYTIEPEHLKTHAMCVGMTGSGKTGLCIALLEELALKGVPIICIDPKGDLGNILFCPRTPLEFSMLIPEEESRAAGMEHMAYAAKVQAEWSNARTQDAIGSQKLEAYCNVGMRMYTPGGGAGIGLSILSAMRAPAEGNVPAFQQHPDDGVFVGQVMGQRAEIVTDTLLALVPKAQQTQQSRSLVTAILCTCWQQRADVSMPLLVDMIADPPMSYLGGLDMETYYPRTKRMRLAQEFNAVMSSPTWEAWMSGDDLDLDTLFYAEGKPTITVINIAHLGDTQRQFFVALFLNQAIQWMRGQPGTQNLKALIYVDEVAGYFPPNGNPPAKRAALTLVKQARAFGLGLMFASQNPVDIDYKLMGNMGLWLVGKLNTERDKKRLEDGLEGMVRIPELKKREFLVRNIHQGDPVVIRSRCTISYLFGPITERIIIGISCTPDGVPVRSSKRDFVSQKAERLGVAIAKQQQVVDELQRELTYAMGGNLLTVGISLLFGRRGTALRQLTRRPPKKAQQLLEARARLARMREEYRSMMEYQEVAG